MCVFISSLFFITIWMVFIFGFFFINLLNSTSYRLHIAILNIEMLPFSVHFLQTNQNNIVFNATSYDRLNRTYGYFISGPKADPTSTDTNVRAACIEYRCPVNEAVLVNVNISPNICQYRERYL